MSWGWERDVNTLYELLLFKNLPNCAEDQLHSTWEDFWCTCRFKASNICWYLSPNLLEGLWRVILDYSWQTWVFFSKPEATFPYLSKPFLYKGLIKSLKPTLALVGVSCTLVTALSWECECVTCGWRSMSPAVYTASRVQPLRVRDTLTSAVSPVTQEDMLFFDSD